MCGIAGFVMRSSSVDTASALERMAAVIAHRGPDEEGFFRAVSGDWQVGLAHRRLSIIDLSTGQQPMANGDRSLHVVFNGEIYNFQSLRDELIAKGHSFATKSDTECILHAYSEWGADCVRRFRGMFAFAVWDSRRGELFLAKDRFGKKPLYLHQRGDTLLFASEVKSILAFPGVRSEVDHVSLWDYFSYRYVPGPSTLFQGVHKLMPGSHATWRDGVLTTQRYYTPPDREPVDQTHPAADPTDSFMDLLDESVRIRMVSDVPFGAFLSGGLDSSAVVALMSRHSSLPIKTFSVGFAEAAYSELKYARDIATLFKTDHHELVVGQDDVIKHLPMLVGHRDAPVAEPSDIPIFLLSREARKSVKMVLTGEGADEFLAGYPKHWMEQHAKTYGSLPSLVRLGLIEPLVDALPARFRRAKIALHSLSIRDFGERMPSWFGSLTGDERRDLLSLAPPHEATSGTPYFESAPGNSALRRILYFDQTSWLPDNLLERGDSMTMAASIEARMPFMDHELAAYVSRLPDDFRMRGRVGKWILREGMKKLLPEQILTRPKVGFRVPVSEWFRGPLKPYLMEKLASNTSRTRAYFDGKALDRVLLDHIEGRKNHEKLLWSLLSLEIWHREYGLG